MTQGKAEEFYKCQYGPGKGDTLPRDPVGPWGCFRLLEPQNAERHRGDEHAEEGFLQQMAGRLRCPETSPNSGAAQDRDISQPGGSPPDRGTNKVIERWLQLYLRQLYEEVSNEPLPSELSDLIERFRKRRQDAETEDDAVGPLPPAARQRS